MTPPIDAKRDWLVEIDEAYAHPAATDNLLRALAIEMAKALRQQTERVEALERGVVLAMQKVKSRPGEPLTFRCHHCNGLSELTVDALLTALAAGERSR